MRIKINADTKLTGLIGTPLKQSLSAEMHNYIFALYNLNYIYIPVEIKDKNDLPHILEGMRRMNFAGFSVTKPYKEAILDFLDSADNTVEKTGACNTVLIKNKKFVGFNTDSYGFIRSLENDEKIQFSHKTFFCIGAGGAAKAACFALTEKNIKEIIIFSRSDSSRKLAEHISKSYFKACSYASYENLRENVEKSDVILNFSGVGMETDETPIDANLLKTHHICYDGAYNPPKTKFLKDASRIGCHIINGLEMLAYQGALQSSLWTGIIPPENEMLNFLKNIVRKED